MKRSKGNSFNEMLDFLNDAREKMIASEQKVRDFADAASDWFWEMGADLRFTYFSERIHDVLGVHPEELIGKENEDLGKPIETGETWKHHLDTLNDHKPFKNFEYGLRLENGKTIYLRVSGKPVFGNHNEFLGYRGSGIDITGTRQAEENLLQSAKLASLGEMATNTAHELNQPLNIIRMSTDTLTEMLENGETPSASFLETRLERIAIQVERATSIIDRMRIFGRAPGKEFTAVSLRDAVLAAIDFLREPLRLLGIGLKLDIPETCPAVMGDSVQLEQVVLNLLTNARDAIEDKADTGRRSDRVEQMTVRVEYDRKEEIIHLTIEDTGGGIPEDILPKIFEPFYTTKKIGKGTGVGLSICYGIVTEMGGTMTAENTVNGARFTVTFPALAGKSELG